MQCVHIYPIYDLSLQQFTQQNTPTIAALCDAGLPLPINTVVNVAPPVRATPCSIFYTVLPGDTCYSIAVTFGLVTFCDLPDQPCAVAFQGLNRALTCTDTSSSSGDSLTPGQVVCVERREEGEEEGGGALDLLIPVCLQTYLVQGGESCEAVRSVPNPPLSALEFYRLNPGIQCNRLIPPTSAGGFTGFEVCIQGSTSYSTGVCPRSSFHTVVNNDRCGMIQFNYFNGIKDCFRRINGYPCLDPLQRGTLICSRDPKKIKKGRCSV
ncbi:hypothetical protein CLOM_g22919 [Closterium sp. NIES-68]|nr:hypothetical protein CLOM_g22919 [Closterium sp. NIES-68]GJP75330.1 hypothetical protein CLOP_g5782 [Closterium sp. NIES-67]